MSEEGRVSIRNIRRDILDLIKKSEFSEDEAKNLEEDVQELVNKYNKLIDEKTKAKENDLMVI